MVHRSILMLLIWALLSAGLNLRQPADKTSHLAFIGTSLSSVPSIIYSPRQAKRTSRRRRFT
jgi:hypothetical protein